MKLLVLEATTSTRSLATRLSAAAQQRCDELVILVMNREGQGVDDAVLATLRARCAHTIELVTLREDEGLGTLLRLLRKRFKAASTISLSFADETLSNPHALRRMHAAVSGSCSYAACGWTARDDSALRNGDCASGSLHTFAAGRIDVLAVAALDALDACEGRERRAVLFESLAEADNALFVDELLVARECASVEVAFEHAHAPTRAATAPAARPAEAPPAPEPVAEPAPQPQAELEDEPLLAHALGNDVHVGRAAKAESAPASAPRAPASLGDGAPDIEENVSDLLRGLSGDPAGHADVDEPPATPAATPAAKSAPAPSLDDEAKALLTELAEEGRLDFAELEASLSKDDPDAIAFVAKLANIPDDLRGRLRALFVDAGGDPREFDPPSGATLSLDDADTSGMDDETRAMLEAAISGPADLSWRDEVVEDTSTAPDAEAAGDKEPSPEALDAALASLQKLEKRIDDGGGDEEPVGALDSFFEDFEREDAGEDENENDEAEEGESGVSALDSFFADGEAFDDEPDAAPQAAAEPAAAPEAAAPEPVLASAPDAASAAKQRAREAARLVAENLIVLQQPNGEFTEKERYAKECAAALWHHTDPSSFSASIQKALDASRRRAEALALQNRDDGQGPLRAFALSAAGFDDQSRVQLDDSRSIDTLVEAVLRSRRGQIIDFKRLKHIRQAYDSTDTLFDRWMPEDPNASPLSMRDQALAAVLIGEIAMRNPDDHPTLAFARKVEDRLITLARTGTTSGMFVAGAAFRCAERRGDVRVMNTILARFESSSWNGDGSSAADGYCESLAFFGLQLAAELSQDASSQR